MARSQIDIYNKIAQRSLRKGVDLTDLLNAESLYVERLSFSFSRNTISSSQTICFPKMGQATGYLWLGMLFPTLAWHSQVMGPTHRSLKCPTWPKCTVVTVTSHYGHQWESVAGTPTQRGEKTSPMLQPWQQVEATFHL